MQVGVSHHAQGCLQVHCGHGGLNPEPFQLGVQHPSQVKSIVFYIALNHS